MVKYITFTSRASNLVSGDTNGYPDVFVRDLTANTTTRVNISTSGVQANKGHVNTTGKHVAISSTGRYIVFSSEASNLIDGQTITTPQLYMRDTMANTTTLVTQKADGTLGNGGINSLGGVSSDGRFVAWAGLLNTNLEPTQANTQSYYVYLADLKTRTFTALNPTPTTNQYFVSGVSMDCSGSLIAFATKLQLDAADTDSSIDVYLADLRNGLSVTGLTTNSNNVYNSLLPSLSCNGDFVVFGSKDIALITSGPVPGNNNWDHKLLYDRVNGGITLVDSSTAGVVGSHNADHTAGVDDLGNVAFSSLARNLIDGYTTNSNIQIFLKHKATGVTELISKYPGGSAGSGSNGTGNTVSISADGSRAVFSEFATATTGTNLLSSDTNGFRDVIMSQTGL